MSSAASHWWLESSCTSRAILFFTGTDSFPPAHCSCSKARRRFMSSHTCFFVWPRQSSNARSRGLSTSSSRISNSTTEHCVGSMLEGGQLPPSGGLEALLEGGRCPTAGAPGDISDVGTLGNPSWGGATLLVSGVRLGPPAWVCSPYENCGGSFQPRSLLPLRHLHFRPASGAARHFRGGHRQR